MTAEEFDNYVRNEWGGNYSVITVNITTLTLQITGPAMSAEAISYIQERGPDTIGMYIVFGYHNLHKRNSNKRRLNAFSDKNYLNYFTDRPDMKFLGSARHGTPNYSLENGSLLDDNSKMVTLTFNELLAGGNKTINLSEKFENRLNRLADRYTNFRGAYRNPYAGLYENTFKFYFALFGFFCNHSTPTLKAGLSSATCPHVSMFACMAHRDVGASSGVTNL